MDHFGRFDFEPPSAGFCQCTANPAINSQFIAEVESMKKGMEASILQLEDALSKLQSSISSIPALEDALSKLQSSISSIPALVEGEMKKQLAVIPSLVEEAVKTQLRASIPELVQQVEGASVAVPAFLPLSQSLPQPITTRASAQQDESSNLHLKFSGYLPETKSLFTKEDIKDQGASLKVELCDQFGNIVDAAPESSAKIKLFVVAGDFEIEDGDEDISKHAVTPREDKPPLLKGKSEISLVEGVASVSEINFTDNSTFVRKQMFKLGAQVIKGVSPGVSIKGAVSDAFKVKEHRNMFNKKPPGSLSLDDEVSNLINIGGKTLEKLQDIGIHLVKDLLHLYDTDFNKLLKIFRGGKKKLSKTIEMAKSCAESALPNQSQMIPDNSQKQLGETSKQIEQTHIPLLTNLTTDEAESFWPITFSPETALLGTMYSFQGGPVMQPDSVPLDTLRELGSQTPLYTAFENQEELREFYDASSGILKQAENVYFPTAASNIHFNATGAADQGVISYQAGEFQSGDISVADYIDRASNMEPRPRPSWHVVRAVLRFRVSVKVPAKEGPRAGKRQRRS